MYEIKLKDVLKEKRTTLTELSQGTGISMNTLSVLGRGESKGIQFDTLDKICSYLKIYPNDLIKITFDKFQVSVNLNEFHNDANSTAFVGTISPAIFDKNGDPIIQPEKSYPLLIRIHQETNIIECSSAFNNDDYLKIVKHSTSSNDYKKSVHFFSSLHSEEISQLQNDVLNVFSNNEKLCSLINPRQQLLIIMKTIPFQNSYPVKIIDPRD